MLPGAVPSHRRAVDLDPRSTICRVCAAVALVAAGREEEAASQFEWLERQPADDHLAAVAVRLRRGLAGDRAAVLSSPTAAERAMAESDEYWSYLMAGAYALVGEVDQALSWLEHAVTVRGWVDYVYFTRHDRFLESLHPARRFQDLMTSAREQYARFTDDGALPDTAHVVHLPYFGRCTRSQRHADRHLERELAQSPPGEGLLVARAGAADVLLMQETKLADADAPVAEFRDAGYELAHHGEGQWNGVAIASPRRDRRRGDQLRRAAPPGADPRCRR